MLHYKRKRFIKKTLYIAKWAICLLIAIVVPMIVVLKYREYDYQQKQAKIIQDFLDRKGLYATNVSNAMGDTPNVVVESISGYVLVNGETKKEEVYLGETAESNPIINIPTQTPVIIQNEYAIVEGDILTFPDEFKITYYCACKKCCGNNSYEVTGVMNTTASGTTPIAGQTIAVCKDQIPFGTTVIIDGHEYVAEDTGGAIKWNRIDIYCDTHQEALNNGVTYATVSIKR